jgi:glycerol-3-phosphate dehydrogenase (NAD(P)+)
MLPTQIIDDLFGYKTKKVVMAGPSFAQEVAEKKVTGIVIASDDHAIAQQLKNLMKNDYFCPEISSDIIGVQLGGALKNVITLGIGMLDGAGFTDNAKAFLLTRGLAEMTTLGLKIGAKQETFYGLSGVGDLVLTSMGKFSKNLAVGRQLGQGKPIDQIIKETGYIPEGVNTVQSLHQLMQDEDVDLPVCHGIYDVIFESKPLQYMVSRLIGCSV